jgi:ABC-type multidrug transport system fused ATPase/permease subunit
MNKFYEIASGTIYLDGVDIKELDSRWLRSQIGVVSQDMHLFSGTIAENISYSTENATQEQIEEAAKRANADQFIKNFPDGYNTIIGERGVSVSAGQGQRISIARAILKNPKILILDEFTSFLDAGNKFRYLK